MKDETVEKVAKILSEWNPLGEKAGTVEDLNGYRVEAIDIISTPGMFYGNDVEKAVSGVLEEAFDISLASDEVKLASEKIRKLLNI
jgi:hypothetical protein